jgi:hypothetical protein
MVLAAARWVSACQRALSDRGNVPHPQANGEANVPVVHECSERGCRVLTMGQFCVEHETARRSEVLRVDEVLLAAAAASAPCEESEFAESDEAGVGR